MKTNSWEDEDDKENEGLMSKPKPSGEEAGGEPQIDPSFLDSMSATGGSQPVEEPVAEGPPAPEFEGPQRPEMEGPQLPADTPVEDDFYSRLQVAESAAEPAPTAEVIPADAPEEDDFYSRLQVAGDPAGGDSTNLEGTEPGQPAPAKPNLDISTMYADAGSMEEAVQRYEQILQDPNVQQAPAGLGYAIYTDPQSGEQQYIAPPSPDFFNPGEMFNSDNGGFLGRAAAVFTPRPRVGYTDTVALGAAEAVGDVAETVAAGVDWATGGTGAVDAVQGATASVESSGTVDALLADGVPAVIASLSVGGPALAWSKGMPLLLRGVGVMTAAEMASSATVGTDEDTLILGPDAAFPIFKGIDLGSTEAETILEHRMNTLTEGMMMGGLIAGAGTSAKVTGKMAYDFILAPIVSLANGTQMEKQLYMSVSDKLANISPASTPEEVFAAKEAIATIIRNNKDVMVPLLGRIEAEAPLTLDTVSAYARGADPAAATAALEARRGMLSRQNATQTQAAVQGPNIALQGQLEGQARLFGGETVQDQRAAIGQSADGFAQQGREYVGNVTATRDAAAARFRRQEELVLNGFENDIEFGQQIQRLENLTGTEIVKAGDAKLANIKGALRNSYETLRQGVDQRYMAIEGGPVDVDAVIDTFEHFSDDMITQASALVKRDSPVKPLFKLVQRRSVIDDTQLDRNGNPTMRPETDEERVERVGAELARQGHDYGSFVRNIRPEISQLASDIWDKSPPAGRMLRDTVRAIDNMAEYVAQNGEPDVAAAAREAHRFYKDEFAPIFGSGRMKEYADLHDTTIGRTQGNDLNPANEFGRDGYDQGINAMTTNPLRAADPDVVRSLVRSVDAVSDTQAKSDIADYLVLNTIDGFAATVKRDGVGAVDAVALGERVQQVASALNDSFPEKAASLNNWLRSIQSAQGDAAKLKEATEGLSERVKAAKADVQASELRTFVQGTLGRELDTTSNPQVAFNQLFTAKEGLTDVTKLMDRIAAAPEAQQKVLRDGMATAYSRWLKSRIMTNTPETAGSNAVSIANNSTLQAELTNGLEIGRTIFKDQPEIMEATETLMDVAGLVARTKKAQPVGGMSPTAINTGALSAVNRLIYMTVGPLSRAGTKMRAIAGGAVEALEGTERAAGILDRIYADPEYFLELAKKYNRKPNDPMAKELLERAFISGTIKADIEDDGRPGVAEGLMDNLEETAHGLEDAAGYISDTVRGGEDDQTDEAFSR